MNGRRNLELNLGRVCNNRCVICLDLTADREARRWLPLDRAIEELTRAHADGTRSVGLLGGEPTAHPDIVAIIGAARDLGFERIALSTNALKLDDPEFAGKLVDSGATRFSVSIHGFRAEDEDAVSGREGNFARKLAAIRNLVQLRDAGKLPDNVSLNAVITTRIAGHLAEFAAGFHREGIRDVRFNLIRTDTCPEVGETMTPRLSGLTPQILRAVAVNARILRMDISLGDIPLCVYPWEVVSDRDLARQTIGEARDLDTWVAIFAAPRDADRNPSRFRWTDRKRHALKRQPEEVCGSCRLAPLCEGIWRSYLDVRGTDGLQAIRQVPPWLEKELGHG